MLFECHDGRGWVARIAMSSETTLSEIAELCSKLGWTFTILKSSMENEHGRD